MPQSTPRLLPKIIGIFVWVVVVGGFSWVMLGDSLLNTLTKPQNLRLAAMPVTPLSELRSHAGTGELVRVRATMSGIPALTDRAGDRLALKLVTQSKRYDRGRDYVVEEWWSPRQFQIGDGHSGIWVEQKEHPPAFLYLPASLNGHIGDDRQLPTDVAELLTPDFSGLRPVQYGTITVYTLKRDTPITIFGVVELEGGQPVIRPCPHRYAGIEARHLLISSYSEAQLNHQLKISGYEAWGLLAILAALLVFLVALAIALQRDKGKSALGNPGDVETP